MCIKISLKIYLINAIHEKATPLVSVLHEKASYFVLLDDNNVPVFNLVTSFLAYL